MRTSAAEVILRSFRTGAAVAVAEDPHAEPAEDPRAAPARAARDARAAAARAPHAPARERRAEQVGDPPVEDPRAELERLRRAMETRPVIDQAHGVLMAAYRVTPEGAQKILVAVSQRAGFKLHEVAAALVDSAQGKPMPEPLSRALRAALAASRRDQTGRDA